MKEIIKTFFSPEIFLIPIDNKTTDSFPKKCTKRVSRDCRTVRIGNNEGEETVEKNSSYSLLQLFLSRVKRLFPSEVGTKKMSPRSSSNSFESSTTFTLHFIREIVINLKRCLLEVPLKNISSIVGEKKKKEEKGKE